MTVMLLIGYIPNGYDWLDEEPIKLARILQVFI